MQLKHLITIKEGLKPMQQILNKYKNSANKEKIYKLIKSQRVPLFINLLIHSFINQSNYLMKSSINSTDHLTFNLIFRTKLPSMYLKFSTCSLQAVSIITIKLWSIILLAD